MHRRRYFDQCVVGGSGLGLFVQADREVGGVVPKVREARYLVDHQWNQMPADLLPEEFPYESSLLGIEITFVDDIDVFPCQFGEDVLIDVVGTLVLLCD